jgi:hypothetical protein
MDEDVEVNEDVNIKDELEIEVENIKMARDPGQPTAKQIEEHRRGGHLPYRLWCKWCVWGRGRGFQHRATTGGRIPIIGIDYFFITSAGVKKREELEMPENEEGNKALNEARARGELVKCLIIRCSATKAVMAHVVPYKGPGEDDIVAELTVQDIAWLGHTRVILKADGEPAIQALVKRVLELAKVECHDLEASARRSPRHTTLNPMEGSRRG